MNEHIDRPADAPIPQPAEPAESQTESLPTMADLDVLAAELDSIDATLEQLDRQR